MADSTNANHRAKRSRFVPLAWLSGLLAAGLLVLGVSGTLSTWTAAILNNTTNSVATSNAVVLQEQVTGSGVVNSDCISSNGGFANTSNCTEINKYGGTAIPLQPGGAAQTTSVTFTNIGSGPANKFVLTPGTCSQVPVAGTATGTGAQTVPANPANLCATTATDLNLTLTCQTGAAATGGTAIPALGYSGAVGNFSGAKTYTATIAKNASVTCTFVVSLSATASPLDGGITVSQPLTWELDA